MDWAIIQNLVLNNFLHLLQRSFCQNWISNDIQNDPSLTYQCRHIYLFANISIVPVSKMAFLLFSLIQSIFVSHRRCCRKVYVINISVSHDYNQHQNVEGQIFETVLLLKIYYVFCKPRNKLQANAAIDSSLSQQDTYPAFINIS